MHKHMLSITYLCDVASFFVMLSHCVRDVFCGCVLLCQFQSALQNFLATGRLPEKVIQIQDPKDALM